MKSSPGDRRAGLLRGVARIVAFNWPFYVGATVVLTLCVVAARAAELPTWVRAGAVLGLVVTGWFTGASVAVSHWVYDRSRLYRWDWVAACLRQRDRPRWINVHVGLDPATAGIERVLGVAPVAVFDVFAGESMTEASIARARATGEIDPRTQPAPPGALPLADDACDAACVILAAHEFRDTDARTALFAELRRVVGPTGDVVVAEHLRDAANFVAFGPGFLHFWSRRTWLETFRAAGLRVREERRITPFVRVFCLERS